MTNDELIAQWKAGEEQQKKLWREILQRGLYLNALGIDVERKDSSWRNPPSTTIHTKSFFKGVKKTPMAERKGNTRDFAQEAKELLAGLDL